MRYWAVFVTQVRASAQTLMQYRADLVLGILMAVVSLSWTLIPMFVLWGRRPVIAGWSLTEALLVMAWFILLRGLLVGMIQPSLIATVDHIRKGTLDLVLVKPTDAQFLLSTARFELLSVMDAISGLVLAVVCLRQLHHTPSWHQVAAAAALTILSAIVLYSLALLVTSIAFYVVRVDSLVHLFSSVFDIARWPVTVYGGLLRTLLTVVIPLALISTYPALALLGRLSLTTALHTAAVAAALALISRRAWTRAIAHYQSASS